MDNWIRAAAAIRCEFYAKLLARLFQHWMRVTGSWQQLNRSYPQAVQVFQNRAVALLETRNDLAALTRSLHITAASVTPTCRRSKRATQPLTFQPWLAGVDA